ncbi:MAG: hypothetical protein M3071_23760 [Actinomycetota bacterium]|nr:hypothetical protein [Actinomycetota bacterium]
MTTRKFAISFPAELHARAQEAAKASGHSLSAWLAQAAEQELVSTARVAEGLAAIADFEAENGAITTSAEDRSWVAEVLASISADDRRLAS